MFLTHNGTRLVALWAGGPLVIPMEEMFAKQYELQLLFRPATINPFAVQVAEAESLVVIPGGGGGATHGGGRQLPIRMRRTMFRNRGRQFWFWAVSRWRC